MKARRAFWSKTATQNLGEKVSCESRCVRSSVTHTAKLVTLSKGGGLTLANDYLTGGIVMRVNSSKHGSARILV